MERGGWWGWCLTRCWVLRDQTPAPARTESGLVWGALFLLGVGPPDLLTFVGGGGGCRLCFENFTVDASIFVAQVFKGTRWMPWHQEPKKDVGICDKPRVADNQAVIRGFPNGETRLEASPVTRT